MSYLGHKLDKNKALEEKRENFYHPKIIISALVFSLMLEFEPCLMINYSNVWLLYALFVLPIFKPSWDDAQSKLRFLMRVRKRIKFYIDINMTWFFIVLSLWIRRLWRRIYLLSFIKHATRTDKHTQNLKSSIRTSNGFDHSLLKIYLKGKDYVGSRREKSFTFVLSFTVGYPFFATLNSINYVFTTK